MLEKFRSFATSTRRNEEGASAVEYGLLVALIAAVVVVAVFALGSLVATRSRTPAPRSRPTATARPTPAAPADRSPLSSECWRAASNSSPPAFSLRENNR